ncbi:MAG: hypothetical protein U0234_32755 [Sandaracinus sp.]
MSSIRCAGCGRRCLAEDAVCLFCGNDPRLTPPGAGVARKAMTAAGAVLAASAIVAAPMLLAACGCGGCGAPGPGPSQYTDAGTNGGGDAGPPQQPGQ